MNAVAIACIPLLLGVAACSDNSPPPAPNVAPPPALAIDPATQALAKDPKFDAFRKELREFRTLTAESAALRSKLKSGATQAERSRYEELDSLIMRKKASLSAAMAAPGVGENDAKAMRYLFSASDVELGGP